MIKDYFDLSWKNLKRRGVRSWLTLLGIFIGIMAVVSLISIGDGLKTAVNSQFGISETELISVQAGGVNAFGPPGTAVVNPLTQQDAEAISRLDSVEVAIPRIIETVKIKYNNNLNFGFAASIPEGENGKLIYQFLELESEQGRLISDGDSNKVLLGNDFLDGEKSGFGKDVSVGDTIEIQGKDFRVAGIMKKKGSFIIDQAVLMMEKPLREIANNPDDVDIIAVKVKDKDLMEKAKTQIEDLMRERRDVKKGEEDFEVSTPQAALATVNSVLFGIQIFIVLVAAISIFIGAVGIVNTMTTSVLERYKEIGIMKAIGAKNSNIFLQFFIEAGLLGLIGGIFGTLFGLGLGYLGINAINSFIGATTGMKINLFLIIGTLLGSFLIGSISGIAPAIRAAKLNPVEALRK